MGVRCIFSIEELRYSPLTDPAQQRGGRMNCSTGFGASMMVTATFAMVAVAQSLNMLQSD
jgi:tRNA A37 threonylcarbamoyladenosine dehydratase